MQAEQVAVIRPEDDGGVLGRLEPVQGIQYFTDHPESLRLEEPGRIQFRGKQAGTAPRKLSVVLM
jgi:hypothetical protein